MKSRPNAVTPSMPKNTAVPSDCRISAPAPVAITSGTTPRMKAKDVIRIGRSRVRAAWTAASHGACALLLRLLGEFDDQDRVLRGQPDQHDEADLRQDVDVHPAHDQARHRGEQAHRHDQDDRERQRPALVLRREHEEDEEHRGAEDQQRRCCPPSCC